MKRSSCKCLRSRTKRRNDFKKSERAQHYVQYIFSFSNKISILINLYNKTIHSYIYMLRTAGQRAGPIGLTIFVDTHWWPGGDMGQKNQKFFYIFFKFVFQILFFYEQRWAFPLVIDKIGILNSSQDFKYKNLVSSYSTIFWVPLYLYLKTCWQF